MAAARSLLSATVLARIARAPAPLIARQFHASSRKQIVHEIHSHADFVETLKEPAVIVDCFATWCGPCKVIAPVLAGLSDDSKNQGIRFVKFDVEKLPDLTAELGVRAMPTFMVFRDGKKVDELMGAHKGALEQLIEKHRGDRDRRVEGKVMVMLHKLSILGDTLEAIVPQRADWVLRILGKDPAAGVSGLTTALLLSKCNGFKITIVAEHMPGDFSPTYASPWAGANFMPMATEEGSMYERRTWPELKRLTEKVPEAGIHFQKTRVYRREKDLAATRDCFPDPLFVKDPWYKELFEDYRELRADEIPSGQDSGCEFTSVCINTGMYLYWLLGQCIKNGVTLRRAVLSHIKEAKYLGQAGPTQAVDFIINATGLGAASMGGVEDKNMQPIRGQTVLVANECTPMVVTSSTNDGPAEILYIMQRASGGGTILGGTYDPGNTDPVPSEDIAARIVSRVLEICPEIAGEDGLKILRHGVGSRPYRAGGVRIEEEQLDGDTWIVHNYGHSGWGYQGSYGCIALSQIGLEHANASPSNIGDMAQSDPPLYAQAWRGLLDISRGRHELSKLIPPALWLADAGLCGLIVWKVPYTEIDWEAYMQQISQYVSGERDYTKIEGGTGPLVYPAAHVYTYTGLYHLTGEGKNILLAQQLFAVLYMATLALVMLCYWKAKVPPYIFPLLILSKRLHSVFLLRCFNDCFATFFLWLSIYFFQRRLWTFGAIAYSWGLGIKMSLLLVLPAIGVVLFLARGLGGSLRLAWLMFQVQLLTAVPFITNNFYGYLGRAFELSRQFKFEWTVNWRMLGEDVFLSRELSSTLLVLHVSLLALFIATRWLQPAGRPLSSLVPAVLQGKFPLTQLEGLQISGRVTPEYIMTTILSANLIGLLFARSLHYQFYAYLAWTTPYLLWRTLPHPVLVFPVWAAQEWAWNVFPSTPVSSAVVVGVLALSTTAAYLGTAGEGQDAISSRPARGSAAADVKRK
ncbi:hypothetical protein S7711_05535 [Stachybotrys chartarum IBT 7711]|uniref:Dol-P-Man:Man(5)GlcNAc(2)-PP-Dol alpha-1,3-mannosyltransferase n=1 Tax=Stachybotrys chartarum (strain CBS 109288 / IBT 7711) TaxID=1280523 RepID=A0A084AS47_STACB|nr:hypothetical protein S7711_05535 [Stachybotrys chartarum IBT 7711]